MSKSSLAVICPVYNDEECVNLFYRRFSEAVSKIKDTKIILIFINNCSKDKSLKKIKSISLSEKNVYFISLSRNFGYQNSILCGLKSIEADLYTIIDVDCEDPPELIEKFLKYSNEGFDLIYGERLHREEFFLIQLMRKFFYRLTHIIADWDFIIDMAEFSLISRRMRDEVIKNTGTYPFLRSDLGYLGFSRKSIPYKRQRRIAGKTHYNLIGMFAFAIAGILSASTLQLRLIAYLSFPLLVINILSYFNFYNLDLNNLCTLLNFSFLIYSFGIISVYLSRVYKDSMGKPLFVIDFKNSNFKYKD